MTAKAEALQALDQARKMLDATEPMEGLRVRLLRGTLDYAAEAVEKIQETKRPRRKEKQA